MPDSTMKLSATQYVMRMMTSETTAIEVTGGGIGLSYYTDTGRLIGGQIDDVSPTSYLTSSKKPQPQWVQQVSGIGYGAGKMTDLLGDSFGNHSKVMLERFEKLINLHDATSYCTSPTTNPASRRKSITSSWWAQPANPTRISLNMPKSSAGGAVSLRWNRCDPEKCRFARAGCGKFL